MKSVIANWKMNLTVRESIALTRGVLRGIRGKKTTPEVVLAASYVALPEMRKILARSKVHLAAQDVYWEEAGAYTGEISVRQLKELACSHVVLGHSERRRLLGETDDMVNKKLKAVLGAKITPIICLGEPAEVRKQGELASEQFVQDQLTVIFNGINLSKQQAIYLAYEPIWAISTNLVKEAKPEDVVIMHRIIRGWLDEKYGHDLTPKVHIIYGGSINKENAVQFLREPAIEGVLVGGASIRLSEFNNIIRTAEEYLD